jgi:hypothetical protein
LSCLRLRVGLTVLARKFAAAGRHLQIDIGISGFVVYASRTDLKKDGFAFGAVLQVMTIGDACLEAGTVSRPQYLFARIGDQHELAFQDLNKLILGTVPMALTRPAARLKPCQIHAELRKSSAIA